MKWVLLACTRTVHGGDVHSILHELVNDSEDAREDMQMSALIRALEQGDISKTEFETIRSRASAARESSNYLPMCPIVPSHSANQALTQVIISPTHVMVLASHAFDVGVPSMFVFRTTLQIKFDFDGGESDRELVICLHKTAMKFKMQSNTRWVRLCFSTSSSDSKQAKKV